jgi:beta-lactamase class D
MIKISVTKFEENVALKIQLSKARENFKQLATGNYSLTGSKFRYRKIGGSYSV